MVEPSSFVEVIEVKSGVSVITNLVSKYLDPTCFDGNKINLWEQELMIGQKDLLNFDSKTSEKAHLIYCL